LYCCSRCRYDAANRRRPDVSRDHGQAESFATGAKRLLDESWPERFNAFSAAVSKRLEAGARDYGNQSFNRPPTELVREIQEELVDVGAWSFILWCRIRRVDDAVAIARRDGEAPAPHIENRSPADAMFAATTAEGKPQE